MPIRLTSVRKQLVSSRFVCPVESPTTHQPTEPTVNTTKPQPVKRAPRFSAVMIAAMAVAIGAIQPATSSTSLPPGDQRDELFAQARAGEMLVDIAVSLRRQLTFQLVHVAARAAARK